MILANLNAVISRLVMSLFLSAVLVRAESPVSNQTLVETAVLRVIDSVFAELNPVPSGVMIEFGSVTGEKRGFLNRTLIPYFMEKEIAVNHSASEYHLNIEQFEAGIVYRQKKSSLFGISDIYQRELFIELVGWIRKPDGEIAKFVKTGRKISDEISESRIRELRDTPYQFQQGEIIQSSMWSKVVEPVLVIVSVTTVVYLFFTMRT